MWQAPCSDCGGGHRLRWEELLWRLPEVQRWTEVRAGRALAQLAEDLLFALVIDVPQEQASGQQQEPGGVLGR